MLFVGPSLSCYFGNGTSLAVLFMRVNRIGPGAQGVPLEACRGAGGGGFRLFRRESRGRAVLVSLGFRRLETSD